MQIIIKTVMGFPAYDELTPIYTEYDDQNTWQGFVEVNEKMGQEIDPDTKKPYGGLMKDELEALADFILVNCLSWGKKELVDNYWLIGNKKVDIGSRQFTHLLEMIYERGGEPSTGVLALSKAAIDRLNKPE